MKVRVIHSKYVGYKFNTYQKFCGRWWRQWFNLKDYYKHIKWFVQRGWRGYSDSDVWGFNYYLATVIANGIRQLSGELNGTPCHMFNKKYEDLEKELNNDMFEEERKVKEKQLSMLHDKIHQRWADILVQIADDFDNWNYFFDRFVLDRYVEPTENIDDFINNLNNRTEEEREIDRKQMIEDCTKEQKFLDDALKAFSKYFGSFWD